MTAKLSATQLHEKLQAQFLNNIRQYRKKSGYPDGSLTDKQLLSFIHPTIHPSYNKIDYSIDLSAQEIKQLLQK